MTALNLLGCRHKVYKLHAAQNLTLHLPEVTQTEFVDDRARHLA